MLTLTLTVKGLAYTMYCLDLLLLVRTFVAGRLLRHAVAATGRINRCDMLYAPDKMTEAEITARYRRLPSFIDVVLDLTAWTYKGTFPDLVAEENERYGLVVDNLTKGARDGDHG